MIELRPYQAAIIEDLRTALQLGASTGERSVLLVSPTGSGKTVMFSYLSAAVTSKGRRVYIVVHRDELIDQVSATLTQLNVDHGFVASGRPVGLHRVMVCSVFTLVNRMADYPHPDLLIVDEAHHSTAGSWKRLFDYYQQAYKLGVTATPVRLDGRPMRGSYAHMIEGPTVRALIDSGDLSPYRLYAPPIAIKQLRIRMGDYVKSELSEAMDKPQITGDAVEHYLKRAAGKRAIAFCVSLDHAASVAMEFMARDIKADRIDGNMDKVRRRKVVAEFAAGRIQVLTSCDLVSEGFDIPALECAILLRPTASLGLYLQQVGRALRRFPGKDEAVILDHAGNAGMHGLPDEERDWTLGDEAGAKKRRKAGEPSIRTCGECFAAVRSGTMVCPYCGWEWPVEAREVKTVDGELEEVTGIGGRARIEPSVVTTLEELIKLQRERGYKPGWAFHVWGARQARAQEPPSPQQPLFEGGKA